MILVSLVSLMAWASITPLHPIGFVGCVLSIGLYLIYRREAVAEAVDPFRDPPQPPGGRK